MTAPFPSEIQEFISNQFVALFTLDREGRITQASHPFSSLVRVPVEELEGQTFWSFLADQEAKTVAARWTKIVKRDLSFYHEAPLRGEPACWLQFMIDPCPENFSAPYVGVINEITSLRKSLLRAEEANLAKLSFFSNMSYELKTPLNAILGTLEILEASMMEEDEAELLNSGKTSARRLSGMINDVLDLAKIESGKQELEDAPFDLKRELDEWVKKFSPEASARGLQFEIDLDEKMPAMVRGDVGRLRQVLSHLVGNGIKFTDKGSVTLTVKCLEMSPSECSIEFSVQDSGIGMSEEELRQSSRAFQQGEISLQRKRGGLGVGLSISKAFVELMDGMLSCESEAGVGSRFYFSLKFPIL